MGLNKIKNWWKNSSSWRKIGTILGILIFLFFIYFLMFIIIRPFMGEITQDRPFMKKLCEMQTACSVGVGPYTCSYKGKESPGNLIHWKGYAGCNESTAGYFYYKENDQGKINIESCNCRGLM